MFSVGVPSLGVSLNGATTGSTRFPLRVEPTVVATLDGSRCSFFEPERMLLSLRNGNGYVITVVYDHAMRNIREFHWQQVLINRYASCITPLEGGFIFVGGKLSDSVLYSCASSPWIEADAALVEDDPMNGDSGNHESVTQTSIRGLSKKERIRLLNSSGKFVDGPLHDSSPYLVRSDRVN